MLKSESADRLKKGFHTTYSATEWVQRRLEIHRITSSLAMGRLIAGQRQFRQGDRSRIPPPIILLDANTKSRK